MSGDMNIADAVSKWSVTTRVFGWVNLAVLLVFVLNVFFTFGAGFPGAALVSGGEGQMAWIQFALYPIAAILALLFVVSSPGINLREDAERITKLNNYLIRAAFWAVFLIGLVDATISFLRTEGLLEIVVGEDMAKNLGRSLFRGPYVHVPLALLSFVIAAFTRTLGFMWLALLIVIAELLIVISRFVFSYEQPFMSDLVRFWYGALFLFASAYTLVEEGHVRVDVFYATFKNRTKGAVNTIGTLSMGIVFCWTILIIGMSGKSSIITAPVFTFEVTQSGFGMYVKYIMAAFLAIFAISMLIQFVGYLMSAVADWREEPGHVDHAATNVA